MRAQVLKHQLCLGRIILRVSAFHVVVALSESVLKQFGLTEGLPGGTGLKKDSAPKLKPYLVLALLFRHSRTGEHLHEIHVNTTKKRLVSSQVRFPMSESKREYQSACCCCQLQHAAHIRRQPIEVPLWTYRSLFSSMTFDSVMYPYTVTAITAPNTKT